MCWAGCDRLAKIAVHLGLADRARVWRQRADQIKATVFERSWSNERRAFVESFGGPHLDASVLLMGEVDMIDPKDPRFVSTVDAIEKTLARGPFMMRYEEPDDFGAPETAFNVCAFWRLDALSRIGRREEAREIFEACWRRAIPRLDVGGYGPGHRRGMGQFSADLFDGGDHQRSRPALQTLGVDGMSRLIVASNRVADLDKAVQSGGLAVALEDALQKRRGVWFGWDGTTVEDEASLGIKLQQKNGGRRRYR